MPDNEAELRIIVKAIDQTSDVFNRVQESARNMGHGASQGSEAINNAFQRVQGSAVGLSDQFSSLGRSFGSMSESVVHATDPLNLALRSINLGVSNITEHLSHLNVGFGLLASAVGIATALGAATEFLATSLSHAAEETTNMIQLSAIWKSMNRGNEESMNRLVEQVKDLSREGMYSSQSVVGATKLFASFGNIASDQLVKATKVAQDFAAFTGMGMEHAAYMIRYAATGEYGMLNRVGIQISETAKKSKDFNIVLEEIAQKMSGQMAAAMETYTGQVKALEKTFDRIQKAVGHVFEQALVPVMKDLGAHFSVIGKQIEEAFKEGKFAPAIAKMTELFGRLAKGVANAVDGIVAFAQTADFDKVAGRIFAVAESVQTLAVASGRLLAWLLTLPDWVYKAVEGLLLFKVAMIAIRTVTGALAGVMGSLANASAKNVAAWAYEATGVRALTAAYRELAAAKRAAGALGAQGPYSPWSPNMGAGIPRGQGTYKPDLTTPAGRQAHIDYLTRGPAVPRAGQQPLVVTPGPTTTGGIVGRVGGWREGLNATGKGVGYGPALTGVAMGAMPALTGEELGAAGSAGMLGGAALSGAFFGPLGSILSAGAAAWTKLLSQDFPDLFQIFKQQVVAWKGGPGPVGGPSKEATVESTQGALRLERATTGKSLLELRAARIAAGNVDEKGNRTALTKEQITILDEAIKREQEFEVAGKKALEVVGREAVLTAQKVGGIFANLSEEEIKEKYKDVQQAIKNFYANVEAADKEAVEAQKAAIDSVTQSKIIAEQKKAEVEVAAVGQSIARAHEKAAVETSLVNQRAAADSSRTLRSQFESDEAYQKALEKLENKRAEDIKAIQQEETQAIEKALEQRYALYQQNADKIRNLTNDLFQNEKATIEAVTRVRQAAMNESDQLASKSAEVSRKMAEAYQAAADNPERAIQLFKEAQSAAQGLAQNIDALKKSAVDGLRGFAEASTSLDKALEKALNVSPFVSWQKDLQAVNQLLKEANDAYAQGDIARAKQLSEQGKSKAIALGTGAPQGMEIPAIQQAQVFLAGFRQVWQEATNKEIQQKAALQAQAEKTAKESGEQIRGLIQDQIKHASKMQELYKQQISALEANTAALRGRQASGEGPGASPIKNREGKTITAGEAGTGAPGEIVRQAGGNLAVGQGFGTPGGTGLTSTGKEFSGQFIPSGEQGSWYGTPGQVLGGSSKPPENTAKTKAKWMSDFRAAEVAAFRKTDEERQSSSYRHIGTDKLGSHMYQDATGRVTIDSGEILRSQQVSQEKEALRAKAAQREAYYNRMQRAGFGDALVGMTPQELDEVMATEKRQSDYQQGTGTYDKRLGSLEDTQARAWFASGALTPRDTNQPFYNAVSAALQPSQKPSEAGDGRSTQAVWLDGVNLFKSQVAVLQEVAATMQDAASRFERLEIKAKVAVDKDGRGSIDITEQ